MHACTVYSLWPRHTLHTRHARRPLPSLVAILAPGPAGPTLPWDSEGTAGPRWSHESCRADRTQWSLYALRQSHRERERERERERGQDGHEGALAGSRHKMPIFWSGTKSFWHAKRGRDPAPILHLACERSNQSINKSINQSGSTLPSDHDGSSLLQPRPDSSSAARQ